MQDCSTQKYVIVVIPMEDMGSQMSLTAPTYAVETRLKCVGGTGETLYMQVREKSISWCVLECCAVHVKSYYKISI